MTEPLSREAIGRMSPAEVEARWPEIVRWLRAGAKDGEAPEPIERPKGHTFTRKEIAGMTPEEVAANLDAIEAQMQAGGIK